MSEPKVIPHILLVEDDVDLADSIRENLEAYGYEVEAIGEGNEALEVAQEGEFHLIVLDVILPGMDGFSICRELREGGNNVPILFLTARDAPRTAFMGSRRVETTTCPNRSSSESSCCAWTPCCDDDCGERARASRAL